MNWGNIATTTIRLSITGGLLYKVHGETGGWTVLALALSALHAEMVTLVLANRARRD